MDNTKEKVTIYVTTYALTVGIFTAHANEVGPGRYSYKGEGSSFTSYVSGKDVHLTEAEALARAEEMRTAKLKSLDKQIKKVSKIKFEVK
jgi:hypothetical protein